MRPPFLPALLAPLAVLSGATLSSCAAAPQTGTPSSAGAPGTLERMVERYVTDERAIRRFFDVTTSPTTDARLAALETQWRARLDAVDFDALERADQVDHVLLRNLLDRRAAGRAREAARLERLAQGLPFAETIVALEEGRWSPGAIEAREAADLLAGIAAEAKRVSTPPEPPAEDAEDEEAADPESAPLAIRRSDALWLARRVDGLRGALNRWYEQRAVYDPAFSWWAEEPYGAARDGLKDYAKYLREKLAGVKGEDDDPLVGDPIGPAALALDLAFEMIPYSPEELLAIGEEQFAWCEAEMVRAATELGFDDWKDALEAVKGMHVDPGEQSDLVFAQGLEMVAFLDERDLVTIPSLCRETWRTEMIDEGRQRTLPFAAYSGQKMLVAYPTAAMDHEAKLEAMRGNNRHFSRCVTPHELIPGHHLQGFYAARHNTHRGVFSTPFYGEGWALYWEMREWDLGWPQGPEDRIGMLFWRMHRAARIIVSLSFHLELMETDAMIDFLVDRVGHERDNATAEVRRYVGGSYGPLYQCGYMIGGLQILALHAELVESGRMTERAFHDAILVTNSMPIELVRAALMPEVPLTRDHVASWRFAD